MVILSPRDWDKRKRARYEFLLSTPVDAAFLGSCGLLRDENNAAQLNRAGVESPLCDQQMAGSTVTDGD
jgi:hypothetical protein